MRKDPTAFRERFKRWKSDELVYSAGLPIYDTGKQPQYNSLPETVIFPEEVLDQTKYPHYYQAIIGSEDFKDAREPLNEYLSDTTGDVVKLTNAGLSTGAVVNTGWLDALADHAIKNNLPIKTALGIAAKETTLGNPTENQSIKKLWSEKTKQKMRQYYGEDFDWETEQHIGEGLIPKVMRYNDLVNDQDPYLRGDPYLDTIDSISKEKAYDGSSEYMEKRLNEGWRYLLKQLKSYKVQNPLDHAFQLYKSGNYNNWQKDYYSLVNLRANELMLSPEILKWLSEYNSTHKYKFGKQPKYDTGKLPGYNINANFVNPQKYKIRSSSRKQRMRDRMIGRAESTNVIDARNIVNINPALEGILESPSVLYEIFTGKPRTQAPLILKTKHMKSVDALNLQLNLTGRAALKY